VHMDCLGPGAPLVFQQTAVTVRIANHFATTSSPSPSLDSTANNTFSEAPSTSTNDSIYTIPASILSFLFSSTTRNKPTRNTNIFPLLQFAVKATPAFRLALSMRDERALWLYCFWLGLMRDVYPDHNPATVRASHSNAGHEDEGGTWWSRARIMREWEDIGRYLAGLKLEERQGAEGRRWAVLMGELGLGKIGIYA